jgi:manganese oxidase
MRLLFIMLLFVVPSVVALSDGATDTSVFVGVLLLAFVFAFLVYRYRLHQSRTAKKPAVEEQGSFMKVFVSVLVVVALVFFLFVGFRFFTSLPSPPAEHSEGMMDHHMEGMEGMMGDEMMSMDHDMEAMPGMVSLNELPLEEPQSILEPTIIIENGERVKEFTMWIEAIKKEIRPGVYIEGWGFNRQIPGPEIRVQKGDRVRVIFENKHIFNHTIHWHGQHVPTSMDGVPGVSQREVQPKETFIYEFIAQPSGTHIYHCHVDTDHHVDMGMYGAFIVEDPEEDINIYDQDVTWVLSSASTAARHEHGGPASSYFSGHQQYGVEKDAFLINGKAFPATLPLVVKEGDIVKLRMINIGKEPYSMHVHGHSFTVTHKDGFPVEHPQEMDTLPILPGERYDISMNMENIGAWVFHDHITQHVTNNGFYPGGMLAMILYDTFELPDHLQEYLQRIASYTEEAERLGHPPEQNSYVSEDMSSMEH